MSAVDPFALGLAVAPFVAFAVLIALFIYLKNRKS